MVENENENENGLACVVFTSMGRILVQYERATTLPLQYPQLALLLASLLQFASSSSSSSSEPFMGLQLKNGYSVAMSVHPPASLACAVIYREPEPSCPAQERRSVSLAQLQSLVILTEFLSHYATRVEQIVAANRVEAAQMAEAYTLSSALNGGGDDDPLGDQEDGTMEEFLRFQHEFVARVLDTTGELHIRHEHENEAKIASIAVIRTHTGVALASTKAAAAAGPLYPLAELVGRAARALDLAFPLLYHTALLQRQSHVHSGALASLANGSISATTLVLQLSSQQQQQPPHFVAIRMLHRGVFASIVYFRRPNPHFRGGRGCELLRDGRLEHMLISDSRGAALLRLLGDAQKSTSFSLHIGSDGAPPQVIDAMERSLRPWLQPFQK